MRTCAHIYAHACLCVHVYIYMHLTLPHHETDGSEMVTPDWVQQGSDVIGFLVAAFLLEITVPGRAC